MKKIFTKLIEYFDRLATQWDNLMEDSEEYLYDEIYFVGTTFDIYDGYDN